jgi:UDP-N-acetylmuramate--alanine ligase
MNMNEIHSVHLIGIGGVGMSALARYFAHHGKAVSGYDRVRNGLCAEMEAAGISISYRDAVSEIPESFLQTPQHQALVIYTPAVPAEHAQLGHLRQSGYRVVKRAEALGQIVKNYQCIAVAGTHGKTTTSAMIAHILVESGLGCNAFLGGVSTNFNSNLVINEKSPFAVVEADEYDRSFLTLRPQWAVLTSIDADHLDIYGDGDQMRTSFQDFVAQINPDGLLIMRHGLGDLRAKSKVLEYGLEGSADLNASNIRVEQGAYYFDLKQGSRDIPGIRLGLPGRHNVENALAAAGIAMALNVGDEAIRKALGSFKGVKRRFEVHVNQKELVFIDDYAHHPTEIAACVSSVREMYPGRRITGVFQPHLFSRTRDFADAFAEALSALDEVVLLEIYPAREKPIPGVDAQMLLNKIESANKSLLTGEELLERVRKERPEVLLTMGAGDIDQWVAPLTKTLLS